MPNEFKIKNGLVVDLGGAQITGSTNIIGSLNVSSGITGSLLGTASFINPVGTNVFVQGGNSFGTQALIGTNDDNNLALETSGSIRMFVSSSGRVGIGTATPVENFDVRGRMIIAGSTPVNPVNSAFGGILEVYNNGSNAQLTIHEDAGSAQARLAFRAGGNDTTFRMTEGSGIGLSIDVESMNDALTIRTDGLIGIGTSSPTSRLQVRGSGATSSTTALRVENSNASASLTVLDSGKSIFGSQSLANTGLVEIGGDTYFTNPAFTGRGQLGLTANATFVLQDNGTGGNITFGPSNRIFINATQQLVLNSTTVIAGGAGVGLSIINSGSQRGFVAQLNNFSADNSGNQTGLLFQSAFYNAGAGSTNVGNIVRINNSNINTAIGTYTFNHLVIDSAINTSAGTTTVRGFYYNPSITSSIGLTNRAIETTSGDILFQSGSSPLFFVSGSGNVGIGTNNPLARLHNTGTSILSGSVAINSTNLASGFALLVNGTVQVGALSSLDDISLAANKALKSVGSVTVDIDSDNNETDRFFRVTSGNQTNTLLHILENGNVGIGKTTPNATLDVSGSALITGSLVVTGSVNSTIYFGSGSRMSVGGLTGYIMDYSTGGAGDLRFYYGGGGGWSYNWYTANIHRVRIGDFGMQVGMGNVDGTARLQVRGSGATSSTTSFLIQNSTPANILTVTDDGSVVNDLISSTSAVVIRRAGSPTSRTIQLMANGGARFFSFDGETGANANGDDGAWFFKGRHRRAADSGIASAIKIEPAFYQEQFSNIQLNSINILPTIFVSSSTSNVTVRGLYYNPVISSLASAAHRAIETTSGDIIFNGGNVGIGTTSPNARLDVSGSAIISGSLTVTGVITGSLFGTASFANNTLTASNISPVISNDVDTRVITANGNGTLNAEGNLTFNGQTLSVLYGVGDEGGEILLGKAATNTTLTGSGVTVDVYQNRLRFFEQGGTARGYYLDIAAGGAGASTNLAAGGGGSTTPGGSNTQIQYNNGGAFGGVSTLTFDGTTLRATGSFTGSFSGSLFGTASYALTSSFIDTVGTNAFIQGGNSFGTQALIGTNDNNNLAFETSGSVRLFISSSGNVGIGTSTPSASLNVRSAAVITDVAFFQSSANGLCLSFNGSRIGFQTAPGGAMFSPFFGFTQGSNVQIGLGNADASARLHVRGNGATSSTTGLRVENSNASASLVVLDNGNVGIGTGSAQYRLDVNGIARIGDQSSSGQLYIKGLSGTGQYIYLDNGAGNTIWTLLGGANYEILENSTSRFAVRVGGNVGINTNNPQYTLHVSGSGNIFASNRVIAGGVSANAADPDISTRSTIAGLFEPSYANLGFTSFGGEAGRIETSNRYWNIGMTGGTAKLNVRGSGATSSTIAFIVQNSTPTNIFTVLDNGNVGINTGSAQYALDIAGTTTSNQNIIRISPGSNAMSPQFIVDDGSERRLALGTNSGGGIFSSGNLNYAAVLGSPAGYDVQFFTTNTARMTILAANGNVGIGTNNPATRLDVSGSGRFTNGLTVTGSLNVTAGITGSLFGTASFASNAALAAEASFVPNTFTQGGNTFGAPATLGTNDTEDLRLISNGDATMVLSSNNETLIVGNTIIGTTNTSPLARLHIQSSGDTSSTTALRIETSTADPLLNVLDNGQIQFNNYTGPSSFTGTAAAALAVDSSGNVITIANTGGGAAFPFTGSAIITGSLTVTGSLSVTRGITGSLFGTASFATSSSRTISSSYALTASFVDTAGTNAFIQGGNSFGSTAVLGTNDDRGLILETSGSARISIIGQTGNVGIGTSSPSARLEVSGSAIISGSLAVTGSISSNSLSGSDERVVTATSDGRLKSTNQVIIQAYLDPNGTQASLLNNASNWNVSGAYVGTTITDTYQGQKHYNTTHFFEAVDNNEWIRLLRV